MIATTTKGNELIPLINRSNSRSATNNRTWLFGDGTFTTGASDQTCPYFGQQNYVTTGMVQSLGKLIWAGNAGVVGNSTTQMLSRLGTDILALSPLPQKVIIHGGLIDVQAVASADTIAANISSIVSQLQTAGIQPILCGLAAADTTSYHGLISSVNARYRGIAEAAGIVFVDNHKVTAQTDGTWISGLVTGGLYPSGAGAVVMGTNLVTAINASGGTLSWTPWQPTTQGNTAGGNGVNQLKNACFAGTFSGTTPQFWTALDNTASSTTATIEAASDGLLGSWWTIVKTDATAAHGNSWYQDVAIGSNAIGSKLAFSVRLAYTEATVSGTAPTGVSVELVFTGATVPRTIGISQWARTAAGLYYGETTIPAGTTAMRALVSMGNGTGTLKIGQIGFVNMTNLGL